MPSLRLTPPGGAPRVVRLDKPLITLGSGADNDITLADPQVAESHAVLQREADGRHYGMALRLRRLLAARFGGDTATLSIAVVSFAYRHGLPREADLVFDVRFLHNPHYVEALRPQTGLDPAVQDYVQEDPDFPGFTQGLQSFLLPLLPRYQSEGKSYLTLAFGCTGGRHRSVFLAELIGAWLRQRGWSATTLHRELARGVLP